MILLFKILLLAKIAFAQYDGQIPIMEREGYEVARVVEVQDLKADEADLQLGNILLQNLELEVLWGEEKGKKISAEFSSNTREAGFVVGELALIEKARVDRKIIYGVVDKFRLIPIALICLVFVILVITFSGLKGIGSLFGFGATIFILLSYTSVNLMKNIDPVLVSFVTVVTIASVSMFLSHGFNKRTKLAYLSTVLLLGLSILVTKLFVLASKLTGGGSEEAYLLLSGLPDGINLRGVLMAGIIIGVMGVLDDITTAQVAAVEEIKKANPRLGFGELYKRGTSVGKEHITSLVNTLILAYAGSSLPLFLLLNLNVNSQPLWVMLNSEFIAEEIVRTLVGSAILVLAVPLTTAIAAWGFSKKA